MRVARLLAPGGVRLAGDLPFFPLFAQLRIEGRAQRLQRALPFFVNDVDLGIVGNGLQRDVRHTLIDEAQADIVEGRRGGGAAIIQLRFLGLPFRAVGHEIIGVTRAHDARTRQSQGHARGIDGDPAAAPLLGHIGRGAGTAGGVQHQITGIGGHEDATFDDFRVCLNDINF